MRPFVTILSAGFALSSCVYLCPGPRPTPEIGFFEEVPGWRMPELAVTRLNVTPERADPGDAVTLRVTVSSVGNGEAPPATLVLRVDDREVARFPVASLLPGAEVQLNADWQSNGAGRHLVRAELEVAKGGFDGSLSNNFRIAAARVSGEPTPQPELEFSDIDFASLQLTAGQSYTIPLKVRNPSFANIAQIPVAFYIDDEVVPTGNIGPLAPGGETEFEIPWNRVTPGEHQITAKMDFGDLRPPFSPVKGWVVVVPDKTVLHSTFEKDKWVSLGPRILHDTFTGRVTRLAFDPRDPTTLYVGAAGGDAGVPAAAGVWKSLNGGGSWLPVGDKLPSMLISSLAVDAKDSNIVYAGGAEGIFKSTDGGKNWAHFARPQIAKDVGEIAVRYTSSGQVMIYARSERKLLRYKSANPSDLVSDPWEWEIIKQGQASGTGKPELGIINDFAVHPANSSIVYISVVGEGIYRTTTGEIAGDGDWTKLATGLPAPTDPATINENDDQRYAWWITLDIHKLYPNVLYAGLSNPKDGFAFGLYRSTDGGEHWSTAKNYADAELDDALYNPYIRVAPKPASETVMPEIIYFGGVNLYQFIRDVPIPEPAEFFGGQTFQVSGYQVPQQSGVDLKALEFDPGSPDPDDPNFYYFSLGDQGVFRCKVVSTPKQAALPNKKYGASGDLCVHRNDDLRVAEIYDFDVSSTNPNLIIGGTQDTGTILYEGNPIWREIPTGDGFYSLINPKDDQIMYMQGQSLDSTERSKDGGKTKVPLPTKFPDGTPIPEGYGQQGYITSDPRELDMIWARGDGQNLYYNSFGQEWVKQPWDWVKHGLVTRIIANSSRMIIGTNTGRLCTYTLAKGVQCFFAHPAGAEVTSLAFSPVDSALLYVTFNTGGANKDTRIWYIEIDPADVMNSKSFNMTSNSFQTICRQRPLSAILIRNSWPMPAPKKVFIAGT